MRRSVALIVLVGLITASAYGMLLLAVADAPDVDLRNPLAASWTGTFLIGLVFAVWNAWSAAQDVKAAIARHREPRIVVGGFWISRSNGMQAFCCACMVVVGTEAMLGLGTTEQRSAILALGGFALIVSQVWNRVDRARIESLPRVDRVEAIERLAIDLATSGRQMRHDVANHLAVISGALQALKLEPGLAPDEVALVDLAEDHLARLEAQVEARYGHIAASDPSGRPPTIEAGEA